MTHALAVALLITGVLCNSVLASEIDAAALEEHACASIAKQIPDKLASARRIAPLVKEIKEPDQDYCHEDLNQCDLSTLIFKDFSLRLLHHKPTHRVSFHIARFSSIKTLERFCGKKCASAAQYDKKARKYVIDCQASI